MPAGNFCNNKIEWQVPSCKQELFSFKDLSYSILVFKRFYIFFKCIMPEFHGKESWIIIQVQSKRFYKTRNGKQILTTITGTHSARNSKKRLLWSQFWSFPYFHPLDTQRLSLFLPSMRKPRTGNISVITRDAHRRKWLSGDSTDAEPQTLKCSSFIKS